MKRYIRSDYSSSRILPPSKQEVNEVLQNQLSSLSRYLKMYDGINTRFLSVKEPVCFNENNDGTEKYYRVTVKDTNHQVTMPFEFALLYDDYRHQWMNYNDEYTTDDIYQASEDFKEKLS